MQSMVPNWAQPPADPPSPPRERGVLLTVLLFLATSSNVIAAALLVIGAAVAERAAQRDDFGTMVQDVASHLHTQMLFVALLCVANVACLVGVWMWKKWGVVGYAGFSLLGIMISMSFSTVGPLVSFAWLAALGTLIAPRWSAFEQ